MRIRAGRGLGDSIYLRPIVDYFVYREHAVTVASDYPDVFIGSEATVEPFTRLGHFARIANYTHRMQFQDETQWDSMLRSSGVPRDLPLRFRWTVRNHHLIGSILATSECRPIILVHGGRTPMQRGDNWAAPLMPNQRSFVAVLDELRDAFRVRIGNVEGYALPVDLDLGNTTSISDLLDLASVCDGVVCQCSFAIPLAEVLEKPLLAIWAAAGLRSSDSYLRSVTPRKVISNWSMAAYVVDNESTVESTVSAWKQLFAKSAQPA